MTIKLNQFKKSLKGDIKDNKHILNLLQNLEKNNLIDNLYKLIKKVYKEEESYIYKEMKKNSKNNKIDYKECFIKNMKLLKLNWDFIFDFYIDSVFEDN